MTTATGGKGDSAKVSVYVAVSPDDAFDVFVHEIDLWWKKGPRYRTSSKNRGKLFFEDGVGGRVFETFDVPSGASKTIEVGKVLVWEPPARLCLEWRNVNFKPGESTFVDVTFEAMGDGTMVTVLHRGWSALREGHPARHGLVGPDFSRMIGMWWGSLMTGLREHVVERRGSTESD